MSTQRKDGYIVISRGYKKTLEHVEVAERAIGKRLPPEAVVHHIDRNPSNNEPANLVICPDRAYHHLIHQRMRAHAASGHYDWRICTYCGKHDAPAAMFLKPNHTEAWHRACRNAHLRANYVRKSEQCLPKN